MSQSLLSDIFKEFTTRGFVLYKFSLDPPPRTYTIQPRTEPCAVKVEEGWLEKLRRDCDDYDQGQIIDAKPLPTLEAIIAEGPEYLKTLLNILNEELVKEQFKATA